MFRPLAQRLLRAFGKWSKVWSRKNLYEFLEAALPSIPEGAQVLNVGAGHEVDGCLRARLSSREIELVSVDIDPGRQPDQVADVCSLPFEDESFDAVFMIEVLEHVHDPQAALSEVLRVLRPECLLVLSAPFAFPIHDRPRDYYRFTKFGLELLMGQFTEVRITARNGFFEAAAVLVMRLLREPDYKAKALALVFMASGGALVAQLLDLLVTTDAITTGYTATARKPAAARSPET